MWFKKVITAFICGLVFFVQFSLASASDISENVLRPVDFGSSVYESYVSNDGYVLAIRVGPNYARRPPEASNIVKYDFNGNVLWKKKYKGLELTSFAEINGVSYFIMFARSPNAGRKFLEGKYTLHTCSSKGDCEQVMEFKEGVMDIVVTSTKLWVLEYKFLGIHYGGEGGPATPRISKLHE